MNVQRCIVCAPPPPPHRGSPYPFQEVSSNFHFAARNPRLSPVTSTPCIMWHMTLTYSLTNHGLIRVVPSFYYQSCAYSWKSFSLLHVSALFTIAFCILHQVGWGGGLARRRRRG